MERSALVTIGGATKRFDAPEGGEVTALDDVSFEVGPREFVTLLGPSGCGKTTLLRALSGFEDLDAGEIVIDGQTMRGVPAHRRPVNTVFQNYALFPHLSVGDNIGYGLDVRGRPRAERDREVAAMLELVGLSGFERRRPRQLSGGQQQRVALARALVNRPKLLLLDEPLSALDRKLRQTMQLELKSIQHELGIAFVFVTHDQEEALTMSDRIVVLGDGRLHQIGSPTEVYHEPATVFVARFVGESNLFAGRYVRRDGRAALVTGSGLVLPTAEPSSALVPDGPAVALVRPEDLEVSRFPVAADAETTALEGTIEQMVFVGTDFQVSGALASGERLEAIVRDPSRDLATDLRPGRPVHFLFRRHAARLLPAPTGTVDEEGLAAR